MKQANDAQSSPGTLPPRPKRARLSMHEDVAVWCDCCSCEAEPYWQAVADELGIELGDDHEPGKD